MEGAALADAPAQARGAVIYRQRCQVCHAGPEQSGPMGPGLNGVVGRKAGSTGYAYSAALKRSELTWSKANLDSFLSGPDKLVPGTRMVVAMPDAKQRGDLVEYLASLR